MNTPIPNPLRVQTNYNSFYSALGAGALMLGIALTAVLRMGGDAEQIGWTILTIGGIWGIIILALGLSNRYTVERERRDARSLFQGEAWATWRWSMEDWGRELEARRTEMEQRSRLSRFTPIIGGIAAAVIGGTPIVLALAVEDIPADVRQFMIALGIFFGVLAIILSISGVMRERRRWQARMERASAVPAPWVRFGAHGLYHETDGHTWLRNMTDVSLARDVRSLIFQIRYSGSRGVSYTLPLVVPIPAVQREDAEALVKRYRDALKL